MNRRKVPRCRGKETPGQEEQRAWQEGPSIGVEPGTLSASGVGEEKEPECRGTEVQGAGPCCAAPKSLSSFGELLAISEGLSGLVGEAEVSRVSPLS